MAAVNGESRQRQIYSISLRENEGLGVVVGGDCCYGRLETNEGMDMEIMGVK
jgi:hypothetical protein